MKLFDQGANDGTFLMSFEDWSKVYDNLFNAIKFPKSWSGYEFHGAWTEANSGGTPFNQTPEGSKLWATNPQYLIEIDKEMDVFISLGQPDQRLVPGEKVPFPGH